MAITVVLDTNILFSAAAWRGNPFLCVEQARVERIEAVTCPELVEELAEKLEMKLGFSQEQVAETLADYLGFIRMVSIPKVLTAVSRDPDDNMVLECAVAGGAQYIVSGDNDLLALREFRDIQIVRARDFLAAMAKGKV